MNPQSVFRFTAIVFTFLIISVLGHSTVLKLMASYPQDDDESETNTEQDIVQKNVCSGWTMRVN
jgi:hypothetical protein